MSNPCSVPRALRLIVEWETPEQQLICAEHDEEYKRGGTRQERAVSDAKFLLRQLTQGHMDSETAGRYYTAIRMFGKAHWGDGTYTDDPPGTMPAQPRVEAP
jgi:hypothetical protein